MDVPCRAPWTSISLDPRGEVRVCCQNQWLRLGNVTDSSLTAIWRGPELERLRRRLRVEDFRLGCDECRIPVERGLAGTAYFHNFDHLVPLSEDDPPWPVQLELALSNTCNLQCVMCNGELSSAIRSRREHRPPLVSPYDDAFFEELDQFLLRVRSVNFLGGEPFLARESLAVMDRLVELRLRPQCSVTTNGTIWNDRVADLVTALGMEVAVSVDGASAGALEAVRVGIDPVAFRRNVERLRTAAVAGGGRLRFLFSLLRGNWTEFGAVLRWADKLDVDVGLNRVEHPLQHSLVHGPPAELERAVAAMENDPAAGALGRNRHVWDESLADLRSLVDERRSVGAAVRVRPAVRPGPGRTDDTFRARVESDANQVIVGVSTTGTPPAELGLEHLVGESLWRLVDVLTARLGELLHSELEQPGHVTGEVHRFVFASPDGEFELTAAVDPRTDGSSCWHLELARGRTVRDAVG